MLPNGILTDAQFEMGVDWPDNVLFSRDGVRLVIRSVDLGRPSFDNLYEHGWYEGVERVRAILVFDVLRAQPGATFEIRNLVVD